MRLTCGRALGLHPLPMEVDLVDGAAEHEPLVCAFAEQFAVDVSGITDNQRKLFATALGDNVFRTVVMIFVADFVPRVWAAFEALGLRRHGNGGTVEWDHDSDPTDALLNGFLPAVARLRGLDPVTTEVVRLRVRRSTTADCASRAGRLTRWTPADPRTCTATSSSTSRRRS